MSYRTKQKLNEIAVILNQLQSLRYSLRGRPYLEKDRESCTLYRNLRQDAKKLVSDPNFDRYVPSADLLTLLFPPYTRQLRNKIDLLYNYLVTHVHIHFPEAKLVTASEANERSDLQKETDRLTTYNLNLEQELEELDQELELARHRIAQLQGHLSALETPSKFEIPKEVLSKLEPLEQTRLQEAVQAYRVNAWTPAAAVCGMILEGKLQQLCRQNNMSLGGINHMIHQLGEANLLEGYYQNLAEIGEFFRHRATHPTSEEFDREKTTLILTSLT